MSHVVHLPDEYMPKAAELPGDLQRIALELEGEFPGRGARITLTLAQLFGGQALYIRKADKFVRKWRDDTIRRRYDKGDITIKELVTQYRLSYSHIASILGKTGSEEDGGQLQLFGKEKK